MLSGHPVNLADPVFLGCTLGAMLPDLDIVFHVKGRLNYLMKHRGVSHSLFALSGMALGLTPILYGFFPQTPWNSIFFWTLVGTLSHGLVDLLNSFGAELLWPFYKKKLTIDMIILTDPVIFGLFLSSLLISVYYPVAASQSSLAALISVLLYLSYRQIGKLKKRENLMEIYQIKDKKEIKILPAMYRPFSWNFLLLQKNFVRFGTIRNNKPKIERILPPWDENNPYVTTALESSLAEIFDHFTPYYHIITREDEENCRVEFMDLRYWSKEDFLYTGRVLLDSDLKIAEETINISNKEGILLSY